MCRAPVRWAAAPVFVPLTLATFATIAVDTGSLSQVAGTTNGITGSVITGAGDLTKVAAAPWRLAGVNNYTGQTAINNGIVTIGTGRYALGSIVGGTVVNAGRHVVDQRHLPVGNLTLNGTGYTNVNLGNALIATGTSIWTGNIVVDTGTSIGVPRTSPLRAVSARQRRRQGRHQ